MDLYLKETREYSRYAAVPTTCMFDGCNRPATLRLTYRVVRPTGGLTRDFDAFVFACNMHTDQRKSPPEVDSTRRQHSCGRMNPVGAEYCLHCGDLL